MRIYLVRHGEAKPKEVDPERGLTDAGRRDVECVARTVAGIAPAIRRIWHSGKRRAAETAAVLAERLAERRGAAVPMEERRGLDPDDPVEPLDAELTQLDEELALVGHLPFLERLAARLLGAKPRGAAGFLKFESGAVLCLERSEGQWRILWFVSPETCGLGNGS